MNYIEVIRLDNVSILTIAALAPGFVGIAVTKLLDGDTTAEPIDKGILKYFLYASSALILTDLCTYAQPLHKLIEGQRLEYIDYLAPILMAAAISIFWAIFGKNLFVGLANEINEAGCRNKIFLDSTMLECLTNDGKGHFLEIKLPNGEVRKGELKKVLVHEQSLLLEPEPAWTAKYEEYTIKDVVYLNSGVLIREYGYRIKE